MPEYGTYSASKASFDGLTRAITVRGSSLVIDPMQARPSFCSGATYVVFVRALERLAAEAGSWPETVEDWQWCARFAYQVIERRGTGGGCFRLMYSRFLAEAGRDEAPLAAEAAARWTKLAEAFRLASEDDEPRLELWDGVRAGAESVLEAELRLWTSL